MASEFQEEENYLALAGPNTYHFAAIKTGTYYIIVSGNQSKGKLKSIEHKKKAVLLHCLPKF